MGEWKSLSKCKAVAYNCMYVCMYVHACGDNTHFIVKLCCAYLELTARTVIHTKHLYMYVCMCLNRSYNHRGSDLYDSFQLATNGIAK